MKEDLLKIINHYGVKHQQRKLNEEVFELIEAIRNYGNTYNINTVKEHIEEEFADVMVLLSQINYYYELDSKRIKSIMKQKVNRQLDRMEQGE